MVNYLLDRQQELFSNKVQILRIIKNIIVKA